jgi:heme exporter protein B
VLADARLVAGKDLRVEWRSRVGIGQMAPFGVLVLLLFGFALDIDPLVLDRATSGLYWVAVLFAGLLAVQRAVSVESAPGVREALRLSGLDPAGYFLGKTVAVAVQLAVLQAVLAGGIVILYTAELGGPLLLLGTSVAATVGIAAAGTLYGALAAGLRVKDTLVPLLLLPVLAPVLLGASRASETALGDGTGNGWAWCGLLTVFAVLYLIFGITSFGTLLEET